MFYLLLKLRDDRIYITPSPHLTLLNRPTDYVQLWNRKIKTNKNDTVKFNSGILRYTY